MNTKLVEGFRVYDLTEERVPVYEFKFLGESNWLEKCYKSKEDFEKGNPPIRKQYPSEEVVLKSLQYFESHWHNYDIVEF